MTVYKLVSIQNAGEHVQEDMSLWISTISFCKLIQR